MKIICWEVELERKFSNCMREIDNKEEITDEIVEFLSSLEFSKELENRYNYEYKNIQKELKKIDYRMSLAKKLVKYRRILNKLRMIYKHIEKIEKKNKINIYEFRSLFEGQGSVKEEYNLLERVQKLLKEKSKMKIVKKIENWISYLDKKIKFQLEIIIINNDYFKLKTFILDKLISLENIRGRYPSQLIKI